jgi:4,5-dihydroxyphthalate decarboxylase
VPLAWWSAAWEEQQEILGSDPWVYGLGPKNRRNLEAAVRYTHHQGLISRVMPLDELFVDSGTEEVVATDKNKY